MGEHERVKFVFVGGSDVGKTALVRRFVSGDFPETYEPTHQYQVYRDALTVRSSNVLVEYWDVGSSLWRDADDRLMEKITANCDTVFGVIDSARFESLEELDRCLQQLRLWIPLNVPRTILANKADSERKYIDYQALNSFAKSYEPLGGHFDWCWTVGHSRFGDYVSARGLDSRQRTVDDVIPSAVKSVLTWRQKHRSSPLERLLDAVHVKPYPEYHWCSDVLLDDVADEQAMEHVIFEAAVPVDEEQIEDTTRIADEQEIGSLFAGTMTREDADSLFRGRVIGSFFVRRSELNLKLRLCVLEANNAVIHAPLKKIDGFWRLGRNDIKHVENKTIDDVLRLLGLHPRNGIHFQRVVGTFSYVPVEMDTVQPTAAEPNRVPMSVMATE